MADFDLAIIGGGINGAGIARDAAGRGLARAAGRAERSRLRHLVGLDQADPRRAALSRARLVPAGARGAGRARGAAAHGAAPHPADAFRAAAGARHALGAGCCGSGLFLYDHLGGRKHPAGDAHDRSRRAIRSARRSSAAIAHGFEYSDCRVDDARLVVLNARRRRRARRRHPHPHALRARRARRRVAAGARCARPRATSRPRACWSMPTGPWVGPFAETVAAAAAGRAGCGSSRAATSWCAGCSSTTAATSCRPPTAASCSRCRSSATSR